MKKFVVAITLTMLAGLFWGAGEIALASGGASGDYSSEAELELHIPIGDGMGVEGVRTGPCEKDPDSTCMFIKYDTQTPNSLLVKYIQLVYAYLKIIIATLASLIVVIGGVLWAMSGGNNEKVAQGKALIIRALVSLGVFITLGLILEAINPEMFS